MSVHDYAKKLYETTGEKTTLVHHPYKNSYWNTRHIYLGEEYSEDIPYNHRTILPSEVVIEYDEDDSQLNYDLAMRASAALNRDKKLHSIWHSGNKSTHIHALFDFHQARSLRVLKRLVMKYYGETKMRGETYLPDLQLAGNNHLIRAEGGKHESTQKNKCLLSEDVCYPSQNSVPKAVWESYNEDMREMAQKDFSEYTSDLLEHPGMQWLLDGDNLQELEDGRRRLLWVVFHTVKNSGEIKDKEDMTHFLRDWNKYSTSRGEKPYSDSEIQRMVRQQWNKDYTPGERYLNDILRDIGKEELIP
jgi:hypothetical protein